MKVIKVYFVDFETNFNVRSNFFTKFLSQYYRIVIDPDPDYLFYSCYGYTHFKYDNCIKIFFTGENIIPDFNICDYGIGFHHLQLEDRYFRFPLYLMSIWDKMSEIQSYTNNSQDLLRRKFCNFVYSNSKVADPIRKIFFEKLSKYKRIDSGGGYLNNMAGKRVGNKLEFIKNYKFTIAIENSVVSGYTTEKMVEPIISKSMPIYYGDPTISSDFNTESFVHIRDYHTLESAVDFIIYLDQHNDVYLERLNRSSFVRENIKEYYTEGLLSFFINIFDQPLELAKRAPVYGCAKNYKRDYRRVAPLVDNIIFKKACGFMEKLRNK